MALVFVIVRRIDTKQAYGLAAPIATSLAGGGPAVMLWGLDLSNCLVDTLLTLALDGSLFPCSLRPLLSLSPRFVPSTQHQLARIIGVIA